MKILKDTLEKMVKGVPALFVKCNSCNEAIFQKHLADNFHVCPKCDNHFRINSEDRINYTIDKYSFVEMDKNMYPVDALEFKDKKPYVDRINEAVLKTGKPDAFVYGVGKINGKEAVFGVLDFSYMGGSMGAVVGEKVTRSFELAVEKKIPIIIVSTSGGARMQEGIYSLMQLPKTIIGVSKINEAKLPYISILADPCMAGVAASYSTLGDINISEPHAMLGFAGKRVIEEVTRTKMPDNFQTAEFFLEHGGIDLIVHRKDMKGTLDRILGLLAYK